MRCSIICGLFLTVSLCSGAIANQASLQSRSGLLWVNVAANSGKSLDFVIDTGAEETVLDLGAAEKLGLGFVSQETVQGVGGMSRAYRSQNASLQCAGVTLRKSFLTLDLKAASRKAGRQLDGLLGADFFHGRTVQIDHRAKTMRVLSGYTASGGAEVLPIRRNYGAMCVPVQVGATMLARVRIDTGSTGGLSYSTSKASRSGNSRQSSIGFTGNLGSSGNNEIRLGGRVIQNAPTTQHGGRLFPGEDGLLGNALLRKFRVTIDMRRSRLILEPM